MDKVLILDFGSQYTQLIARRVRELKVYSEIHPYSMAAAEIRAFEPTALILSGSPASIYQTDAPRPDPGILDLGLPVLGICYGLCALTVLAGGQVARAARREYGPADLLVDRGEDLFADLPTRLPVWMSHGDQVTALPEAFRVLAHTDNSPYAAFRHRERPFYGVQFHPEVVHTPKGKAILANFLFRVAKCQPTWTMRSFVEASVARICDQVGTGRLLCGLSGGVDSSVAAVLAHQAVGDRLTCVFVDNGLLRMNEAAQVVEMFGQHLGLRLIAVDAGARFLEKLAGVADPERKRKVIGAEFIAVFEEEAARLGAMEFLLQGTLYPDVIESVSVKGPSVTIKTHHNVGGLPEKMGFKLVEPLRELFKDEVREVGKELGLPDVLLWRQPFPGPGLAVRCVGDITRERLRPAAPRRRHRRRGDPEGRPLPGDLAGLRRTAARPYGGRDGRRADLRARGRGPRRPEPGRHDRRLGPATLRCPGHHQQPHRQRSQGREPRGVRRQQQAAKHDRVGMRGAPPRAMATPCPP